ncbi:homeobox-DDT domain protein RLT1 [Trifolium repens]|nr:homeobox-DDT domain protein RLT1 [Trifolium repens]
MEEKFNGGRKIKKQYHESDGVRMPSKETMVAKRAKVDLLHQYDIKQAHVAEIEPRKTQRSAVEMPSSFTRNAKLFQDKQLSAPTIAEDVKLLSWNWLRVKSKGVFADRTRGSIFKWTSAWCAICDLVSQSVKDL